MTLKPSIAEIKAALQARVGELARHLAPGGTVKSGVYTPLNPTRADRHPGSFVIWLQGDAAGAFKDYATGDKGDVIDLVGYCMRIDNAGAIAWSKQWLGLAPGAPAARPQRVAPSPAPREDEAETKSRRIKQARAIWLEAHSGITEYPLPRRYFESRGIDLTPFAGAVNALRFAPNCWYSAEQSFPAIVACMQTEAAGIVAVHRTYLAPDGSGKAPVTPVRKMLGLAHGAVIAVWRGQSGMPVRQANEAGIADTLVLTEGIEDALSVALSKPDCRVWAIGSLGNLAAVRLPACAHDVIVFADNDWVKPEAEKQLAKGMQAIAYQNQRVRLARSSQGKDANDLLRGEAA